MLIHGLMGDGLGFLCAAPKSGKSWLAMEIGICVATGTPLWGHQVRKGAVLHLPLEDTYQRITQRLWRLADEVDGNLFFATEADALAGGLLDQLADFHESHPDLALVIIDTLQMVRTTSRDYSYSADYRDISELKRARDNHPHRPPHPQDGRQRRHEHRLRHQRHHRHGRLHLGHQEEQKRQ